MSLPALSRRESRCEHQFIAGLCPIHGCLHAEVRPKRLTSSSPLVPVSAVFEKPSASEFVAQCIRYSEARKIRAHLIVRRWNRAR